MNREYWPTAGWKIKKPTELGFTIGKFNNLERVIKGEYINITGIVIVKNGYIAYENYFNGYNEDKTQKVASVTKSVLSALIGIAIDKGFIKGVNEKVLDFFPEYELDESDQWKKEITLEHLLTMTAPYKFEHWQEPFDNFCSSEDWGRFAIDMMGTREHVGEFKYSTEGAHLLSIILTRATGKSAREFANEYLFSEIGMREIPDYKMTGYDFEDLFGNKVKGWVHDSKGNSTGGWGLTLTPRDMARFGYLYINDGVWNEKQIISKEWIKESLKINDNKYGYLWWLDEYNDEKIFSALGDSGNAICCIPSMDLVVAIASDFMMNPADRLKLIKENIL